MLRLARLNAIRGSPDTLAIRLRAEHLVLNDTGSREE
jgi:hypothetical protein